MKIARLVALTAACLSVAAASLSGCAQAIVQEHRAQVAATTSENRKLLAEIEQKCRASLSTPQIDSIRNKVVLYSRATEPVPVELLVINDAPTQAEKAELLTWARLLEVCGKDTIEYYRTGGKLPTDLSPELQSEMRSALISVMNAAIQGRNVLIAALYNGSIATYGEFNRKRAELNEKIAAAYRQWSAIENAKERQEIVGKAVAAQQQLNAFVAVAATIGCAEAKGRAAAALCN